MESPLYTAPHTGFDHAAFGLDNQVVVMFD